MKYVVTVAGRDIEVGVDGDQVTVGGRTHRVHAEPVPGSPLWRLDVDGASASRAVEALGRGRWAITEGGERFEVEALDERTRHIRSLTGASGAKAAGGRLAAPMPGLVVRVLVEPGQMVSAGQGLVVLEAMKMENELKASIAGTVTQIAVNPGQAVEKGALLVTLEPV